MRISGPRHLLTLRGPQGEMALRNIRFLFPVSGSCRGSWLWNGMQFVRPALYQFFLPFFFFFNGDIIAYQNPHRLNTQMIKLCLCTQLNMMAFSQVEADRVLLNLWILSQGCARRFSQFLEHAQSLLICWRCFCSQKKKAFVKPNKPEFLGHNRCLGNLLVESSYYSWQVKSESHSVMSDSLRPQFSRPEYWSG